MTVVQQVLFEVESPYFGHPYFVSGNAVFNAVASRVDERTRRSLHVSHGVFVPGEYGEFPEDASQDGYAGKLGKSLPEVNAYEDLFVFRDAAQRWLLSSRPRDAHNVLPVQSHGGRVAFAPETWFGRPEGQRKQRRSVSWYVHCYVHSDVDGVVPVSEDVLDGLQLGGARNYGFGEVSVVETQLVDLDALDYSGVREADGLQLELVTPYVLASEAPDADSQSVPWWWGVPADGLRRRETRLVNGDESHAVATVDHGQVVEYDGGDAVRTAKNGVTRVGTHSRFGFGEFRLRPCGADRVPERTAAASGGDA
ncbi:hypothetical protein [Halogeometricum limi]|uniref:hypothetical protein n=1 Tax=Halogeometricum limi TaxID=555875 RepID=UPI000B7F7959|nr:hypothetical protein [Halogeometricum limi]